MDQPPTSQEQPTAAKRDRFSGLRGLRWWEPVLSLLPIALIGIGGLLGGLIGGVGLVINLALARRRIGGVLKSIAMIGVAVASYVVYIVVAATVYSLIHR